MVEQNRNFVSFTKAQNWFKSIWNADSFDSINAVHLFYLLCGNFAQSFSLLYNRKPITNRVKGTWWYTNIVWYDWGCIEFLNHKSLEILPLLFKFFGTEILNNQKFRVKSLLLYLLPFLSPLLRKGTAVYTTHRIRSLWKWKWIKSKLTTQNAMDTVVFSSVIVTTIRAAQQPIYRWYARWIRNTFL